MKSPANRFDLREAWLRAATSELRPYFASVGFPLAENIRFAIAFLSTGRKGKRVGECWHSSTSDDSHYEIFIRADLAEPIDVLGVLAKELVHTGDAGRADLRFHDNSNLSVGPKSSVRLDKFVYDPNKSAGSVAVEATRGSFRFVTGSQSKGSYQVKTPYGTLGVRGALVLVAWAGGI